MQYTLTSLPKSEIEIRVTIPFDEFKPHLERAAVLISKEIEIEGFRRGKAPYEVVKNRVGENAIYERAAEVAVRKTYPEILQELVTSNRLPARNPPIGRPEITITKLAPGNDPEYKARTAILPAVTLPDYTAIARRLRKEKKEQLVSEEEVDRAVQWLRESRTQLITVERSAAPGDRVEVDFEIRKAGVKITEGESKNHPIVIGEKRFIPGFEDALIGMKAGEEKRFTLTAPDNWREQSFAGKTLDFTAAMKLVQERRIPELNEEFAKGIGDFATLDALKTNVQEGLVAEKNEKETQRIRGLMIAEIGAQARVEVPDALIILETDKMTAELKSGTAGLGMRWEDYLRQIQKSEADLRADWLEEALRRVRIALCLREIASGEHIDPGEEEITDRANRILQQFRTAREAERSIDPAQLREYAKGILRNEKVFTFLENV